MKNYEDKNIFFISDLHLGHKNVIKFDNRPFLNIEEMNVELIKRWNSVVNHDDVVYCLGDLYLSSDGLAKWFLNQINGRIYFVMGNHDKLNKIKGFNRFEDVHEYGTEINVLDTESKLTRGSNGYQRIILSHYPILSWNKSHYSSWHLHGHCHGSLVKSFPEYYKRKVMDVGCNVIGYKPISYTEVKEIMNSKYISNVDHHYNNEY